MSIQMSHERFFWEIQARNNPQLGKMLWTFRELLASRLQIQECSANITRRGMPIGALNTTESSDSQKSEAVENMFAIAIHLIRLKKL